MENVSNTNKANPRDADAVFGEYVASELRSIKNEHTKRVLKFRIQSMLFSSLSEWSATPTPHEPWPDSLLASAPPPSCTSVLPVPSVATTAYPTHATEFGSNQLNRSRIGIPSTRTTSELLALFIIYVQVYEHVAFNIHLCLFQLYL